MPTQAMQDLVVYTPVGGNYVYHALSESIAARDFPYNVRIMEGVTTDLIIDGLKKGAFDLVFMHRLPREDEGVGFFELAHVNVAIFTHPDVVIDNLTSRDLAAIFSGEITNWADVGGPDQAISVFRLPEMDSTTVALRSVALGDGPFCSTAQLFPSETQVMLAATGMPGGIGYATWATLKYLELVEPGNVSADFHLVTVDGAAVNEPGYPISIVLGFGYMPHRKAFLQPLFDWIDDLLMSPEGSALLALFDVQAPHDN